eukprot:360260-Amphidinium_carterae.2
MINNYYVTDVLANIFITVITQLRKKMTKSPGCEASLARVKKEGLRPWVPAPSFSGEACHVARPHTLKVSALKFWPQSSCQGRPRSARLASPPQSQDLNAPQVARARLQKRVESFQDGEREEVLGLFWSLWHSEIWYSVCSKGKQTAPSDHCHAVIALHLVQEMLRRLISLFQALWVPLRHMLLRRSSAFAS